MAGETPGYFGGLGINANSRRKKTVGRNGQTPAKSLFSGIKVRKDAAGRDQVTNYKNGIIQSIAAATGDGSYAPSRADKGGSSNSGGNTSNTSNLSTGSGAGLSYWERAAQGMSPAFQSSAPSAYARLIEQLGSESAAAKSRYDQQVAQMRESYNWDGEDPAQRAIRDWTLRELAAQEAAGSAAVGNAYRPAISSAEQAAVAARARGRENGVENAAIYTAAAEQINADNARLAEMYGQGVAALGGGGPVDGAAVETSNAARAAAAREQTFAAALGQIAGDAQAEWAASLGEQQAAQQGQLVRDAAAMKGDVSLQYAQRDAERRQRELEAMRAAITAATDGYNSEAAGFSSSARDAMLQQALAGDVDARAAHGERADLARLMFETDYANGTVGGAAAREMPSDLDALFDRAIAYQDENPHLNEMGQQEVKLPGEDEHGRSRSVWVNPEVALATGRGIVEKVQQVARTPEEFQTLLALELAALDEGTSAYLQYQNTVPLRSPSEISNYYDYR